MKDKKVKWGILGAAKIARSLAPAIRESQFAIPYAVASRTAEKAQAFGREYGFERSYPSYEALLHDPEVQVIYIPLPNGLHCEWTVKALKAGKHVFVEKPLAINSAQLSAISKQLKAKSQSLLTVGFNRRFSPLAQNLKLSIGNRNEPLHAHYRINAGYIPAEHWTQDPALGGGRIIGEACHFIDVLTFLVGAAPVSVSSVALPNNGRYSEDNVSMTFTFPDGSIGVVDYLANGDKSMPKERLEVFCEGMVAVLDDYVSLTVTKDGKKKEERMTQDKGWRGEMAAFAESIKSGGEPPIPYQHLISVTRSTFAAVESIRSKQSIDI